MITFAVWLISGLSGAWQRYFGPIRFVKSRVCCILAGAAVFFGGVSQAQVADGVYHGLDGAQGIAVQIVQVEDGYIVDIVSASSGQARFEAEAVPNGVRGPLVLQGKKGIVEFRRIPVGLSMVWRPDAGGDELIYAFTNANLELPQLPPGYKDPPPPGATRVNPVDFLTSYEFWEAAQVARTYDGLDDKYRVIMKSFATVHTDILWKLCRAPVAPDQLTDALRGQGVTCSAVQNKIRNMQQSGKFSSFKRAVHFEKTDASVAVECAWGANSAQICARAARRTQQATLSLETAGTVLGRF